MVNPTVFVLPIEKNKKEYKNDIVISSNYNQPLFSLGFHSFQHRTKSAMTITEKLETKKKFYNIVNPFDPEVLDIKKTISTGYYKFWEILSLFNLVEKDKIVYGSIAEAPGSFVEAYIDFREKYYNIKNDKIYSVTLKGEKEDNIETMNTKFMSRLKKDYSDIFYQHKTSVKSVADKYKGKDNGDITDVKTIANFKKDLVKDNNLAHLVSADGDKYIYDNNYKEQEAYILIFGQILAALNVQKKGGHFVLKLFDTFTMVSVKILYLLSQYYGEMYIYKPYTSLESDEEKYIICKNFKYDQKEISEDLKKYDDILQKMNTNKFIFDIFSDMEVSTEFINNIKFINIQLVNKQQMTINKIVTFIKKNNYFGEDFHNYKDTQEKNHDFWRKTLYSDNIANSNIITKQIEYNESEFKLFNKTLV